MTRPIIPRPKTLPAALTLLCALLAAPLSAHAGQPIKIAIVDTGNTGRSVTAEALAQAAINTRHLPIAVIGRGVDVDPFDIHPEPGAATILARHGIDVSTHLAAQLSPSDVKHADLILTMTAKHKATILALYPEAAPKTFTLAEYATNTPTDIVDAYGKPMEVYETVYTQIETNIPAALEKATHSKIP